MRKVALFIGHNGSGLQACIKAAQRLQANTVAVLGSDDSQPLTQAMALQTLLRRLTEGEFDTVVAWLDESGAASLTYMARLPAELSTGVPSRRTVSQFVDLLEAIDTCLSY